MLCIWVFLLYEHMGILQTCLLVSILRIFYAFGHQITHYKSQLQNYTHEKVPIFNKFSSILLFSSAMVHSPYLH